MSDRRLIDDDADLFEEPVADGAGHSELLDPLELAPDASPLALTVDFDPEEDPATTAAAPTATPRASPDHADRDLPLVEDGDWEAVPSSPHLRATSTATRTRSWPRWLGVSALLGGLRASSDRVRRPAMAAVVAGVLACGLGLVAATTLRHRAASPAAEPAAGSTMAEAPSPSRRPTAPTPAIAAPVVAVAHPAVRHRRPVPRRRGDATTHGQRRSVKRGRARRGTVVVPGVTAREGFVAPQNSLSVATRVVPVTPVARLASAREVEGSFGLGAKR